MWIYAILTATSTGRSSQRNWISNSGRTQSFEVARPAQSLFRVTTPVHLIAKLTLWNRFDLASDMRQNTISVRHRFPTPVLHRLMVPDYGYTARMR